MAFPDIHSQDFQRQFINAELVQSDYSQWERTVSSRRITKNSSAAKQQEKRRLTDDGVKTDSAHFVGPGQSSAKHFHHHAGPACPHQQKSQNKATPTDEEDEVWKDRRREIKVLQLIIKERRKALTNYKARQEVLLGENTKLRQEIEGKEKEVHNEVKSLLHKYERFRGAVSTLTSKFETEKALARKEYDEAKERASQDVEELEKQRNALDAKLRERKAEISLLMSYKDKEYPVRAVKIAELQKQIHYLSDEYEAEINDLVNITAIEKEKYHQDSMARLHNINATVTDNAIESMNEGLKEMAVQNITMRKEIEDHQGLLTELESSIENLTQEVQSLQVDPKTSTRKVMFPHLFKERTKCTPDMDVVLDIPTREWLPI